MIRKRLESPKVAKWFDKELTILNECSILTAVPPASQAAPQPVSPDLNQTLAGLQTDVQQLARGLESLSHELGRIFQYMEQQGNGSKEERK